MEGKENNEGLKDTPWAVDKSLSEQQICGIAPIIVIVRKHWVYTLLVPVSFMAGW